LHDPIDILEHVASADPQDAEAGSLKIGLA
jgi:hypothetical protein